MVLGLVDLLAKDFPNRANWKGFFERAAFPKGIRDLHTSTDSGGNGSSNEAVVLRKEHPGPLSLADISTLQTSAASGNIRGMLGGRESGLLGGELDSATMESALCFFFGDRVKERVEKYFDSMFPEFRYAQGAKSEGLTLAERRNEIAEHESRIADIGKELSEIERSIGELKPPSANFGMSLEALRSL